MALGVELAFFLMVSNWDKGGNRRLLVGSKRVTLVVASVQWNNFICSSQTKSLCFSGSLTISCPKCIHASSGFQGESQNH